MKEGGTGEHSGKHDEADGADSPSEAHAGEEAFRHGGEDEAAGCGAGGTEADCEGAILQKVHAHERDAGDEYQSIPDPGAHSLSEE